eukprot:TRINITY_DN29339_c0_g1_i1.p1 TRINITY_DN29339_c0_g1~~TRINITY_DN29339_c0_g1_i1.p1  ORF type:complete len:100 (-),score=29.87 TRINITY_DN29339_c0_g1_i1:26-325(-)
MLRSLVGSEMCIRDSPQYLLLRGLLTPTLGRWFGSTLLISYPTRAGCGEEGGEVLVHLVGCFLVCLLYTSDAADEEDSVDLGGRRIIKKKKIHSRNIEE